MKRYHVRGILMFAVLLVSCLAMATAGEAKRKPAKKLKLGTSYCITQKGAVYHSDNTDVVCVDKEGRVTAKKIGTAVVSVKKNRKVTRQKVKVIANGRKTRYVYTCTGEVRILKNEVTNRPEESGEANSAFNATIRVRNRSRIRAAKVIVEGTIGEKQFLYKFGAIESGEAKTITLQGRSEELPGEVNLEKLYVYSRGMYTLYNYQTEKTTFHYGTPDKTPPVITGFLGKDSFNRDSHNRQMPYQVIYGNDPEYDYFKYVRAKDDRGGKVKLTVDTGKVNFSKRGIYKIIYRAEDQAGNSSKATAKIQVRIPKKADLIADEVLQDIIEDSWSDIKKARAIYNYTREHISYVGYSNKTNWEKEAVNGIRYGKGDCFTYYAVARILLTRAGIPNLEVTRVRGEGHHWWSMVYVKGGWYHYDCGPRRDGGRFCLLTDAQLKKYSKEHKNVYIWDYKGKPKTPKKQLSTVY